MVCLRLSRIDCAKEESGGRGSHKRMVELQERLGHSSINVTLDTYSHVLPNMQEAVLRSIGDSITGTKIETENPLYLDKG